MVETFRVTAWLGIAVVSAVLATTGAAAQEEVESEPDRWQFQTNLALTSTSGNDDITVFVTDGKLTHLQTDAFKGELSGRIRYGRSGGEDVAQNVRGGITLDLAPRGRWAPFVFSEAEKDPFKKLDLRTSSGTGVRYQFISTDAAELSISGAALHSYENFELEPASTEPEIVQDARWRWIAKGRRDIGEGIRLEHESYYEPVWDRADDYSMEMTNAMRFQVNTQMSFHISHLYQRDSTPPEEVKKDDSALTVGVSYQTSF